MAIEIKEFVGYADVYTNADKIINIKESAVPQLCVSKNSVMVDIEGIHSGIFTINLNEYTPECLENSIPYWTHPYPKPVIMHHQEEDGEIIGRILGTKMITSEQTKTDTLLFTCNIGDKKGVEGVNNGTLATVSIGAVCYDVRCSICGKNIAEEGECEHRKGSYYDGELCHWIIKDMEPKELSYVIVPSDKYAHNVKVYKPNSKILNEVKEMSLVSDLLGVSDEELAGLSVTEAADTKEAAIIDETVKDKVEGGKPEKEKKDEKEPEEPKKDEDEKLEEPEQDEKEKVEEKEEKPEEDDIKEDEDSNKQEEEDEKVIETLKARIKELEDKIKEYEEKIIPEKDKKLEKVKEAKEKVEIELAGFKVKEKQAIIDNIIALKESVGIPYENKEDMAQTYSTKELQIMHKTLKESCDFKSKTALPNKIEKESLVDSKQDNTIKVKESAKVDSIADEKEMIKYNTLLNSLFKK